MVWWNFFKFLIYSLFLGISSSRDQTQKNETTPSKQRPHIIFILADDVGWNDASFHGSDEIPTPNIDALAYHGVILDRHYVHPICTPSRTALMTGRYASRAGMQGFPMSAGELRAVPLNNATKLMPEYFQGLGYRTRLLGKWHLGYYQEDLTPARRGFDSFYGYYNGFINYFDYMYSEPDLLKINVTRYDMHDDDESELRAAYPRGYFTDMITEKAEETIKAHALNEPEDRPLFLEIAHLAGHASIKDDPLEVRDRAKVDAEFGHIESADRRKYAGMIRAMDESVGRVVKALSDAGMLSNSIIVFASDNGAPTFGLYANSGSNHPFRGARILYGPYNSRGAYERKIITSIAIQIKATLWEGGVRGLACVYSPLIESRSRVSDELVHEVDWLPSLYAAAGGRVEDLPVQLDGVDQWPMISRGARSRRSRALLNIDEVAKTEAAIIGKHKLLKGARNDPTADFVGATGNDPAYPAYRIDEVLESMAGRAIRGLDDNVRGPSASKIARLRAKSSRNARGRCKGSSQKRLDCSGVCLFDLERDPCETRDISKQRPRKNAFEVLESECTYIHTALVFCL
ncbi:unnamed protein product [Trichogramma brassicae]|uniref:Sulfatase N-terminal domain-containing protein n=1 Tax=Trichogramma brassicae TaxID=86971 RepID=A0A6H5IG98_9HYME|nr:unnamed protein product [Trichogramma brassicae]